MTAENLQTDATPLPPTGHAMVLLVDDQTLVCETLRRALANEPGIDLHYCSDAREAIKIANQIKPTVILQDLIMPGIDGLTLVRHLRRRDRRTPVLMLSGVATTADRVEGLQAGCDDYLPKPYSFSELLARLEALGRRSDRSRRRSVLRVRDLEIDTELRTVSRGGRVIELQRREYLLLEQLVRHAGQVVTRSMLLEAAWTYDFEARGHIVDMHIHRLRHKIDDGFDCRLIHTVTGAGYTVRAPDAATP